VFELWPDIRTHFAGKAISYQEYLSRSNTPWKAQSTGTRQASWPRDALFRPVCEQ
jgi:hypothetical protein